MSSQLGWTPTSMPATRKRRNDRMVRGSWGTPRDLSRGRPPASAGQPEPDGDRGGFDPPADPELAQDVRDVDARGALADEQLVGDLAVRPATGEQSQDLQLAGRELRQDPSLAGTVIGFG